MLQGQTVLDPFEGFLNSPPRVIERPEFGSGIGVESRSEVTRTRTLWPKTWRIRRTSHTRRGGNFVVQRILFAGSGQPDDLLGQAGSAEGLNSAEIEAVRSHAEVPPALQQGGEEPVGWVTAVEHQNVLGTEFIEMFEEHLTLADVRRIQRGRQGHFDPGQIQCEANGVDHVANKWPAVTGLAEQSQAQDRGIAGDDPQTAPEGKAELRIDQGEEVIVEKFEGGGRHLLSGFGKGLCGDFSQQVGAVRQIGEERVEFRLHFRRVSAEQAGDQAGKTEEARSRETFRRKTRIKEKSLENESTTLT
ncbi:hypothetical protein [Candidatus Accumulibacter phosphatis]|uniref:hypothetical protein n=1 Tax=Candidatus Accumulibacter phosphatis TaxID=327160 RepID=UPI0019018796